MGGVRHARARVVCVCVCVWTCACSMVVRVHCQSHLCRATFSEI